MSVLDFVWNIEQESMITELREEIKKHDKQIEILWEKIRELQNEIEEYKNAKN